MTEKQMNEISETLRELEAAVEKFLRTLPPRAEVPLIEATVLAEARRSARAVLDKPDEPPHD